jgi:hypothetical protein
VRIRLGDRTERVQNETQDSTEWLKKTDAEILRTERMPQETELLTRIQEPGYRTEKMFMWFKSV